MSLIFMLDNFLFSKVQVVFHFYIWKVKLKKLFNIDEDIQILYTHREDDICTHISTYYNYKIYISFIKLTHILECLYIYLYMDLYSII